MLKQRILLPSLFTLFCWFSSGPVSAEAPCGTDKYRDFDFWLGYWKVTTPEGKLAGHNRITQILNTCVIKEEYRSPSGYAGTSLNIYDRKDGKWHQTWVDNTGFLLKISGNLQNDSMVMTGPGKSSEGKPVTHKITWSANENGSVRQLWEVSPDQGVSWKTVFDGLYEKVEDPEDT